MRVTRDSLIRIAKETVQERVYNDPEIIAAYLTGSLLSAEPMLGGTADIDLVFVYKNKPAKAREFVKLTPDFHLDISRRAKDEYKSPRELRGDPWLGFEMYAPMLLYEREKFFDFLQASLRAGFEFEQPPLMLQRCRAMLSHGRGIWTDLIELDKPAGPKEVRKYMKSLFHAINTVAEISGSPIQERRLLLEFPARAEAAQKPGMVAAAYNLIGANNVDAEKVKSWLADWKAAFKLASETADADARIHAARLNYYEKAIQALLDGKTPLSALWPVLHTWTLSAAVLNGDHLKFWQNACAELGLLGDGFTERVEGLDHFIDEIEATLDEIATENGLETFAGV
jgi:predicted nucleotidyltransferase